ncbi:hypothetical protein [Streptomyces sp. CB01881]|uniref:hypothetical protein n=1 Tax=Streptomyces sp. CB01881 TaxID=2078691 RepID=UPI000CDBB0EF|nr:hypothetical protein [Streptomyces sp. CB01881]AUY50474.1 hypothetical protein C2142_17735 [Streptomyces sp. CB01881]TYC73861.1 hypothetical protein EH183_17715 [Streptomyces sp. CB01881]
MSETKEYALQFVRTWAEAVVRQAERARAVRVRAARDSRNYEHMEDWSPTTEEIEANFREQWAEEHMLVWAAHQLERWEGRLRSERGQDPVEPDELLKNIRDALEHLDEVDFKDGSAVPPSAAGGRVTGKALRRLPGEQLWIELHDGSSFEGVSPETVETHALAVVRSIEDDLEQQLVDRCLDLLRDR